MYSRPWPVPQAEGLLIHHVSDSHIGYRPWSYAEMDRMQADIAHGLIPAADVMVHTGDVIDDTSVGSDPLAKQDGYAIPWLTTAAAGKPSVVVPGNHDLFDRPTRAAWETAYGRPALSYVDVGGVRIVGFAPDTFTGDTTWTIPDATWSWLDGICSTGMPVILADHYPPQELGMGAGNSLQPASKLDELVAGHSNIAGMLAGHMHFPINDARSCRLLSIGGRLIPVVCDNSAVFTADLTRDQLARLQTITTWIDVTPDRWRVHYRLHGTRAWSGPGGLRVTTMDLAAGTVTHGM